MVGTKLYIAPTCFHGMFMQKFTLDSIQVFMLCNYCHPYFLKCEVVQELYKHLFPGNFY
jgi:hypothetical protein